MPMHQINDAVVHAGKIELSNLPFADGQHVRILVTEQPTGDRPSIQQIRQSLKGCVERFEDPFEPMIPSDQWEMLK
jgi:hypothetical protein